jgi:hypothetical protein
MFTKADSCLDEVLFSIQFSSKIIQFVFFQSFSKSSSRDHITFLNIKTLFHHYSFIFQFFHNLKFFSLNFQILQFFGRIVVNWTKFNLTKIDYVLYLSQISIISIIFSNSFKDYHLQSISNTNFQFKLVNFLKTFISNSIKFK